VPSALRYRLQTLKTLLAALLVLASVVPAAFARVTAAWVCEGRVCGFARFYCCCDAPAIAGRDARCATLSAQQDTEKAGLCAAPCNCRLVLSAADGPPAPAVSAPPAPVHPPLLALPPSAMPSVPAPVVRECTAARIEARGPPAALSAAASSASPRAPPHA